MAEQGRRTEMYNRARRAAPKVELEQWHGLSVVRYVDGSAKAWHTRIDLGTRRLIAESLADPVDSVVGLPWHVLALTNAAEELEVAHRMSQGLW